MADLKTAAEHALRVLDEIALDLVNTQLAEYRQMYRGGYKPHRVKSAEDDVMAVQNTIAELRIALGVDVPARGNTTCNPHPDAPHGFNRNASHNAGRYVCDCEGWMPPARGVNPSRGSQAG